MPKTESASKTTARTATARKSNNSNAWRISDADRREIERLAYQFYVERGYQHGFHEQDWARAEAIVRTRRS